MLQCRKNTNGFVDVSLSQFGLFLATAVLLTVVFSLLFLNDWQRTAELQSMTSDFSHHLEDLNTFFFEHTRRHHFPQKHYEYTVRISTEYIVISAKGSWGNNLLVTKRFITKPWPRLPTQNWTTGEELHVYLNETYGHYGTQNDTIPLEQLSSLLREQNMTHSFFAVHPLEVLIRKPVVLEKVSVYYDSDKKHDFLLLYQHV